MSPAKHRVEPQHVRLTINHPNSKDFYYSATVGKTNIDKPKELRVHRGDSVTFENPDNFILRFRESPFDNPEKTVLYAVSNGREWTVTARVRETAVLDHWYHYTVIMGDCSTDDPEIIIER